MGDAWIGRWSGAEMTIGNGRGSINEEEVGLKIQVSRIGLLCDGIYNKRSLGTTQRAASRF